DLSSVASENLLGSLNQPALDAARYKGALIGLPYAVQGVVLYRNKGIVTINPDSYDELVTLAQTSTIGDDIGAALERSFFYSGAHLEGMGGRLMDEEGLPAFNDQKGLEWLELLLAFEQAGPSNYFTDEDLELFKSGRVGWIVDGTWNLDELAQAIGPDRLAIDAWPTYRDGRLSGYVRAENLYLNPRIQEQDLAAARAFIEYFLSPEAQTHLAEVGRIPAASGVTIADPINGPLLTQAMIALANGTTYPVVPEMALYNIYLDIALRSVFEEQVPPEQALQIAQQAILAAIAESQAQVTTTP
ncbi:MAG: extracellular solute-binding protein, partial [Anaerolineales bacterium]|nr:extracellular solute-binding protein [Anaerolineales bacterium]